MIEKEIKKYLDEGGLLSGGLEEFERRPQQILMAEAVGRAFDKRHHLIVEAGTGIESEHVPLAFGTVLYGSKFGLKQARGMFGLGATMAILYEIGRAHV